MLDFAAPQILLLTLLVVRTAGIVVAAPVFGTNEVPPTVRALLAFTLAVLIWPTQAAAGGVVVPPTLIDFGLMVAAESLIGLVLGLGVLVLFAAFQLTGHLVGQLGGMSLGDVFNPGFDDNLPLFSQLLYLLTLATYALVGGHRLLIGGLLDTFATIPPGAAGVPSGTAELLTTLLAESFDLGIRAAAPATVALLLATVVLGLVSRSLPQLNILALGFGFNALVTFGVLGVSLGGVCWLLQERLEPFLEAALTTIGR